MSLANNFDRMARRARFILSTSRPGNFLKGWVGKVVPPPVARFDENTPHFDHQTGIFRFHGTDREIGRQFAEAFRLEGALSRSERVRNEDGGERVRQAHALLEQFVPSHLEFLRGIADAQVRYPLETVIHAACSTVLTEGEFSSSCSSLAFDFHGKPVIGQNLDLGRNTMVALACIVPEEGIARMARITLGYLWLSTFMNAAGVVAVGSSVNVNRSHRPNGTLLPQTLLFDTILSTATSVHEAISILDGLPPFGPENDGTSAIFADFSGAVRQVEITGDQWHVIKENSGIYITTNHFRHPAMAPLNRNTDRISLREETSSLARYRYAMRLIESERELTPTWLRELLRTEGEEGAWLRKGRWPDVGYTSVSYLINLPAGEIEFWLGAGAEHSVRMTLAECFGSAGETFRLVAA